MRLTCPHCRERTFTRTSKRPLPVFYQAFVQCTNPACGWAGKIEIEFASTRTPSQRPDPSVHIPLDPESRKRLIEQLQIDNP